MESQPNANDHHHHQTRRLESDNLCSVLTSACLLNVILHLFFSFFFSFFFFLEMLQIMRKTFRAFFYIYESRRPLRTFLKRKEIHAHTHRKSFAKKIWHNFSRFITIVHISSF